MRVWFRLVERRRQDGVRAGSRRFINTILVFLPGASIRRYYPFDCVIVVTIAPTGYTSVYEPYLADIPFIFRNDLSCLFSSVDEVEPKLNLADSLNDARRPHNCADLLAAHAYPQFGNI